MSASGPSGPLVFLYDTGCNIIVLYIFFSLTFDFNTCVNEDVVVLSAC